MRLALGPGFCCRCAGVLVLLGLVIASNLPNEEALAERAAMKLETALGVNVSVARLHWQLWPVPVIVMEDLVTAQAQPIAVKRLTLYPDLSSLWQRCVKLNRAELDGAVVPLLSLSELRRLPHQRRRRPGQWRNSIADSRQWPAAAGRQTQATGPRAP